MPLSAAKAVKLKLRTAGFKILAGFSLVIIIAVSTSLPANPWIAFCFPIVWLILSIMALIKPAYADFAVKTWVLLTTPAAPLLVLANGLLPATLVSIATIFPMMLASGWWRFIPLVSIAFCTFLVPLSAVPYDEAVWIRLSITNIAVAVMVYALIYHLEKALIASLKQTAAISDALTMANQAKQTQSNFLSTMSHEIRTPMNGILGLVESVLNHPISEQQRPKLELIKRSGVSLNRILNDILDLSKMTAGKLAIERLPTNLRQVINDVIATYVDLVASKQVTLSAMVDPALESAHICDPTRVSQILSNLVSNAIKFTDEGSIQIEVKVLKAGEQEQHLRFLITDTGSGMDNEKLSSIFEPYVQANHSDARKFGGTGLGLQITKHLVESMGGSVNVESNKGQGSKFWFDVLFEVAPALTPAESANERESNFLEGNILVVDDNEINRIVVREMLAQYNLNIFFATNGVDAVKAATSDNFQLILMDLNMPLMDGYEATKEIRKLGKDTPIVAFSAAVLAEEVERAIDAGANQHLAKPINQNELAKVLKKYL
ncbi:ATP-binding protein [Alteromonas ponticola]|uniref:histidine kinase n=1 Tax=Alteromonas ponticola TaxID=2720613 RepID=A0ABX1R4V6_9ALTE|nr:ATP-binding protein [Alteromonas ponticola]NMH61458.1 response regulator [Alteromonas ponticola]